MDQKEYLQNVSDEIHKTVTRKFTRRKVNFQYIDQTWSCDLVDMSRWAEWNNGYKWMLNCVDGFSRFAFSEPMKDKTAKSTYDAFKKIVSDSGRKPDTLWVDSGKEFYNLLFKKAGYSKEEGTMYSVYNENKSCIVERFNRTLKTEMWKRGTAENTRDWIQMLPELIDWYNNRKHSTLGMTPAQASEEKNKKTILKKVDHTVLNVPVRDPRKAKFKIGDFVRISRVKGVFDKGYEPGWSQEEFKIISIVRPNNLKEPLVYRIADYTDTPIDGTFYQEELQKSIKNPGVYLVESWSKTRTIGKGKNKHKEYFVKWLGYSDEHNSWVPEDEFTHDFNL